MNTKVIRTEEQHHQYLEEVGQLLTKSRSLSKQEHERLELLTVLIEAFENSKYAVEPVDAIDAILFRMEEKGLKRADLIPYLGTSSRVSEILNRKRPLTVQMIRALSVGLGISADTLIGISDSHRVPEKQNVDWAKFPIKEMMKRGWLENVALQSGSTEDLVRNFIHGAGLQIGNAAFRRTLSGEAESPTTKYALLAWLARVIQKTRRKREKLASFDQNTLSASFLKELAQLSWSDKGPILAVEFLERIGIRVVIEPCLKGTQLDGAALRDADGTPIVGLTLRYDRLDNFWFTLLHEVAHLWKHVRDDTETFMDDLNVTSEDRREAEANRLAQEAFIPRLIWRRSEAYLSPSKSSIEQLSRELKIHPSVIVGRLRRDSGNYALFSDMIGQNEVKKALLEVIE